MRSSIETFNYKLMLRTFCESLDLRALVAWSILNIRHKAKGKHNLQ
jgi:hypothetical protein